MKSKWLLKAGKMLAIAIIAVFVIGCVVMLLWNALVPELFKGPVITYWQAIGLLVLSHILLRGWGHDRHHWRRERLSYKVEQRLAACVQIVGPIASTYRWKGCIETKIRYNELVLSHFCIVG